MISLTDILKLGFPDSRPQRIWLAYSGGLDSQVLLHIFTPFAVLKKSQSNSIECRVVHVHHGLHRQADDWADHGRQTCANWGFPYTILYVNAQAPHGASPEEYARQARYTALAALLTSEKDVLLTAHHADDQAETLLLQLLRGAGPAGLAAMPTRTRLGHGWLVRPLLPYTRAQLAEYGRQHHLCWVEDSSNLDPRFDRNYLRHHVFPQLRTRWPSVATTLSRVAQHQADAQSLLETLAQQDLTACHATANTLDLSVVSQFSPARQRHLLRYWLKQSHGYVPTTAQLQQILDSMLGAQRDRHPIFKWDQGEIRRYQNTLFKIDCQRSLSEFLKSPRPPLCQSGDSRLLSEFLKSPDKGGKRPSPTIPLKLTWQFSTEPLILPWGQLIARPVFGQGLRIPPNATLQVGFRQGGERFFFRGHHHRVKKLLQDSRIPPWQRAYLPFIYLDNTLIMLPWIGLCDHFRVVEADQEGWDIGWYTDCLNQDSQDFQD